MRTTDASASEPRRGARGTAAGNEVSVVVMAYNEAGSLEETVEELLDTLQREAPDHELLIVDDGSTDATGRIAVTLAETHHTVRVIHHQYNLGLGGVYRTGFEAATGRRITFFPADGQFPPTILAQFLPHAKEYDLVLGYAGARPDGPVAAILSAGERLLYRALIGRVPRFQGVFMVDREALDRLSLTSTGRGWAIVMEMILRAQRAGCRIVSVPTPMRPRRHGTSKVRNLSTTWANLRQLLVLRRCVAAHKTDSHP